MIRINKFAGLLTAASPYIVPTGGATEQVNVQSRIPGQLQVRGGMQNVEFTGTPSGAIQELWGYNPGAEFSEKLFAFSSNGGIYVLTDPEVVPNDPEEE